MIRLRTRLLLCGASLAPGVVMLWRVEVQDILLRARSEGSSVLCVLPGLWFWVMLLIGFSCFVAFVISLVLDLRRAK